MLKRPLLIVVLVVLSISLGYVLVNESSSDSEGLLTHSSSGPFAADVLNKGGTTFVVDDILYSLNDDGSVTVKGHEGIKRSNIIIPSIVRSSDGVEHTVTSIGKNAFKKVSILTSVIIPDTVTKIGEDAFKECKGLKTISIPIDVDCGKDAFEKVKIESLTLTKGQTGVVKKEFWKSWKDGIVTLVVDKGVHTFDTSFKNAKRLETVSLMEVESIGEDQFRRCNELESFSAPGTLSVGDNAFMDCTRLLIVNLDSVGSIGRGIFVNCHKLSALSSGMLFLFQMNVYMILDSDSVSLVQYIGIGIGSIVIPSLVLATSGESYSVTDIGKEAFRENKEITRLTIPGSIVRVGEHAFHDCTSLKALTIPIGADCSLMNKFAFEGVKPTDVTLTKSENGEAQQEFWRAWSNDIVALVVDKGIRTFDTCFKNAKELRSVILMEVGSIGEDQFRNCEKLQTFVAPCVFTVGDNAFMDSGELCVVEFDSLKSIARGIFVNCYNLTSISTDLLFLSEKQLFMVIDEVFVSMIQYLDKDAKTYVVPSVVSSPSGKSYQVATIGKEAIRENDNISEVQIPDSVVKVDEHAFHDCKSLKTIMIPISVDCSYNTGKFAFEGVKPKTLTLTKGEYDPRTYTDNEFWKPFRSSLKNLTVGSGITEFETSFKGKGLKTLTLQSVERIHEKQFDSCNDLLMVSIPSAVVLERIAFGHCNKLLAVEMQKVKEINEKAFLKCGNLASVTSESVEVIGKEAFRKCSLLKSFNLSNVKKIGYEAFWDTGVKKSSLPKGVKVSLSDDAFGSSLKSKVLTTIGSYLSIIGEFLIYGLYFSGSSAAPAGAAAAAFSIGAESGSALASFATAAFTGSGSLVGSFAGSVGGAAASGGICASISAALPYVAMVVLAVILIGCLAKSLYDVVR